jgi:hypothetical protein
MAYRAVTNPMEQWHLLGDVRALFIVAIVLGALRGAHSTVSAFLAAVRSAAAEAPSFT